MKNVRHIQLPLILNDMIEPTKLLQLLISLISQQHLSATITLYTVYAYELACTPHRSISQRSFWCQFCHVYVNSALVVLHDVAYMCYITD